MRKRGYDVVARPYVSGGSHYLNMHPESAWEGAVIIECSSKDDIIKLITEIDGRCLDKNNINSIKCFRIDILEISQRGVTACEKGD